MLSTYIDNYNWFLYNTLYPLHDNVLTFIRCFNLGLVGQHQCMEKVSRPLLPIRWSHLDDPACVTFKITYVNTGCVIVFFACEHTGCNELALWKYLVVVQIETLPLVKG